MSVNFWCPQAPMKVVKVPCWGNCDSECPDCHGDNLCEMQVSPHELNLANTNARNILHMLGEDVDDSDLYGAWETPDAIRKVRGSILKARNVSSHRVDALRETTEEGGFGKCRVVNMGYTDDQVQDRLARLDVLLSYALENGYKVTWG